jgi:hypothetical protein
VKALFTLFPFFDDADKRSFTMTLVFLLAPSRGFAYGSDAALFVGSFGTPNSRLP